MRNLKQSTAANIMAFMTASADHVTGLVSGALTITLSKDGGAFSSISPTVTERGSGWYNIALTTAHTDTLGDLVLHITATSADPTDLLCRVVAGSLDADVSSRLATVAYVTPDNASITSILADTNELQTNQGNWLTATGFATPTDVATIDIDGTYTLQESLRLHNAALAGKMIVGGSTIAFRNTSDTKDVIVATMDAGSRSAIVLDVT